MLTNEKHLYKPTHEDTEFSSRPDPRLKYAKYEPFCNPLTHKGLQNQSSFLPLPNPQKGPKNDPKSALKTPNQSVPEWQSATDKPILCPKQTPTLPWANPQRALGDPS